ncbi:metallophosphatase [Sinorhizobium glycinis]|uniref:Metallophosphatase n=1 Tax=Sinorhizobium glycinis TaxID=1472378 RepID=A0A178Y103_9HYPH|nr:ligase-associated DNA damage response endonuclease PdeM [Sinorhizobium glycinis]OAP41157.1 metallophosphatase [Sinorhizobium glycinis]
MHRLVHATSASTTSAPFQARIAINSVAAICDPLGGLFLPETGTLVVSDLHLEKGSAFARRGMMLPPYDTLATLRILEAIIARHSPATVISLGDNFHDRRGSAAMPDTFRQMIEAMARGRDWIWINGNHDPDGPSGVPGASMDELRHAGLVFRHEPSLADGVGEIAGHLHPSATVRRRERSIRRACFATDGKRLLMPAFGVTTGGLDLRHRAMTGLFDRQQLVAHMMGRDRIYSVRFANLLG